ncbi:hypothetical protein GGI43DRAFT_219348 [Trichoderma evansii]
MALDRLAPELLYSVLSLLDSPQDLYSLIRASPACLQAFLASRGLILTSVIRNGLSPDAVHHALALLHTPKLHADLDYLNLQEVKAFLDQYFNQADSWSFPKDLPNIISLMRFTARVFRFVDKFFDSALQTLGTFQKHDGSWPLSPTERARLQRAFLRFELYCQLCPAFECYPPEPFFSPDLQFRYFLAKLEPWEAEEISCIHEYFTINIGQYIADLQDRFLQAVLENPQLRAPPNHDLRGGRVNNQDDSERDEGEDMEYFHELDISDLALFSTDCRYRLQEVAGFMASLGLEFLEGLMSSDTDRRWDIIRRNSPRTRGFLPEALHCSPNTLSPTIPPEGDFENDSSRPGKGWFDFKGSPYDEYISILFGSSVHRILCICGYVFWDCERISHPTVREAFKTVRKMREAEMPRLYNPSVGQSAEEQLKGFQLPKSQMLKITQEFGSIWLAGG